MTFSLNHKSISHLPCSHYLFFIYFFVCHHTLSVYRVRALSWDASKLWFTYLCLSPPAATWERRQRAEQGLCQCKSAAMLSRFLDTPSECHMNRNWLTCIIHAAVLLLFSAIFCKPCSFYWAGCHRDSTQSSSHITTFFALKSLTFILVVFTWSSFERCPAVYQNIWLGVPSIVNTLTLLTCLTCSGVRLFCVTNKVGS